jgi:hypothetical protein
VPTEIFTARRLRWMLHHVFGEDATSSSQRSTRPNIATTIGGRTKLASSAFRTVDREIAPLQGFQPNARIPAAEREEIYWAILDYLRRVAATVEDA